MENVFNINHNINMDKLKIQKGRKNNKKYIFIKNHKFISLIFISFLILSTINFYLIYSFVKILENI